MWRAVQLSYIVPDKVHYHSTRRETSGITMDPGDAEANLARPPGSMSHNCRTPAHVNYLWIKSPHGLLRTAAAKASSLSYVKPCFVHFFPKSVALQQICAAERLANFVAAPVTRARCRFSANTAVDDATLLGA